MASGCCFGAGTVAFVNLHKLDASPAYSPSAVHRRPTVRSPKRDLKLFRRSEGDASFIQKWRTHMYGSPHLLPRAALSSTQQTGKDKVKNKEDERVQQIHTIQEFEEALRLAKNKLVVVEYAASHSYHSRKIYPFMVDLSRTCPDVIFLLVMGDESEETKELCARESIETVPHFSFYKNMEKIHEEEGIAPDQLEGDVLYYGDPDAPIHQLHSRRDVDALLKKHAEDNKLVVLDVGLKHCGPCVKVYPTVVKLSRKMADTVVFARMNGDENDECMEFLREMDVVEVPTFLFIKHGKIHGRYVGSGKGELIGEILRYQGVGVA